MGIKSSTGQLSNFQFLHNNKYCGGRQGGAFSPNPQWLGEKDVQLVLRLIYWWTVCAWTQAAAIFRAFYSIISGSWTLCRWSQCWCSNYPRVTKWNLSAAHNSVCNTKWGRCRHASRVSWSLGPDLRQLFECHRNNVNDVQPVPTHLHSHRVLL